MEKPWIGIDLDGCLAFDEFGKYPENITHIGPPIWRMVKRVQIFLKQGKEVKIFTARVAEDSEQLQELAIRDWCKTNIGIELEVTCSKDFDMLELWDDRAIGVEPNTGITKTQLAEEKGYLDGLMSGGSFGG